MSDLAQETSVRDALSPMFIGLVFAAVLGGFTIVQALTFLQTSTGDPLLHKLVVYFLLCLDMLHLSFFAHPIYHYLASNPDDTSFIWSFPALLFVQSLIVPIAQLLYIARIWKLTPRSKIYIPIALASMSVANLVTGISISCSVSKSRTFAQALSVISERVVKVNCVMGVCSDVLIAGFMVSLLVQARTNPNWTDSSLTMLLAYFLNTGMIASFLSIAVFAAILAMPQSLIFLALEEIAVKFYVNSVMGMLNARHYLQSHHQTGPATTLFLQSETSSHVGPMDRMQGHIPEITINEIGLPLFKLDSTKSETDKDIRMEVMVKQESHQSMD